MMYEYAVMRDRSIWGEPDILWRGPWVETESLLWEDAESDFHVHPKEWCERWVKETEEMGVRPGAFYVARKPHIDIWEKC